MPNVNYRFRDANAKIANVENGLLPGISFSAMNQRGYNIHERMHFYNVPGVSIAVIDEGKIVWTKGYGIKEIGTDREVSAETLFQVGSVGKMIAALTTLSLVNKGILNLDEDVNEYLRSWHIPENEFTKATKITLRQLLSHTAGVIHHSSGPFHLGFPLPSLTDHLKTISIEIFKKPGEGYYYSGAGYIIIEQIIEDVTDKDYKRVAEEEVLKPLGMENTHLQIILADDLIERAAFAHYENGVLYEDKYPVYPCYAPGTCNWSTAEDLARLFIELRKSYYGKSNKTLRQSLTMTMMTNLSPAYGLGIKLINENRDTFIGHSGDFYGFHACLYGYLEKGKGIVVLTNGDNGVLLYNEIIRSVAKNYDWHGCKQEIISTSIESIDLKRICGCYFLPGKLDILNIYTKDMKLYCDVFGYTSTKLLPITPYKFYNKETDALITFNNNSSEDIKKVEFRRIGVRLLGMLLPGFDLLFTDRFEEAKNEILEKKEEYSQKKFLEVILNNIGYILLEEEKYQNAINVFELAIAIYPKSPNLYASLGRAYMKNGQKGLAITNYKKSLKLNPRNKNAKEMLVKLEKTNPNTHHNHG